MAVLQKSLSLQFTQQASPCIKESVCYSCLSRGCIWHWRVVANLVIFPIADYEGGRYTCSNHEYWKLIACNGNSTTHCVIIHTWKANSTTTDVKEPAECWFALIKNTFFVNSTFWSIHIIKLWSMSSCLFELATITYISPFLKGEGANKLSEEEEENYFGPQQKTKDKVKNQLEISQKG